jgi:diaminopimelate decarboxylase
VTTLGAPTELIHGGISVARAIAAVRRHDPHAHAFHLYDLDALRARARRFLAAFGPLKPLAAFAIKANGLPAILESLRDEGIGADAGSLGELELAAAAGFDPARMILNGNGRTTEEARWAATRRIHSVNADHVAELDLLNEAAAGARTQLRVALRVNPGIETPGHHYVATGHDEAKFGITPDEALEAWGERGRWPHLRLDGLHVHVGSQLVDPQALERALDFVLDLARAAGERGARLGFVNLGGGFGVDYEGQREFPLEAHATRIAERVSALDPAFEWVFEPGRWLVATTGILVAEVLWVKRRNGRRFVVVGAGMNDFLRPALYGARHRIVAVTPRPGAAESAVVVGPVCESADVFDAEAMLPPVERGDWLAFLDTGAYGSAMASNYNGRGRLAEVVVHGGGLRLARVAETPADLAARHADLPLGDA